MSGSAPCTARTAAVEASQATMTREGGDAAAWLGGTSSMGRPDEKMPPLATKRLPMSAPDPKDMTPRSLTRI